MTDTYTYFQELKTRLDANLKTHKMMLEGFHVGLNAEVIKKIENKLEERYVVSILNSETKRGETTIPVGYFSGESECNNMIDAMSRMATFDKTRGLNHFGFGFSIVKSAGGLGPVYKPTPCTLFLHMKLFESIEKK